MNLDRLNHLKVILQQVAEKRFAFDMNSWADHVDKKNWKHWPEHLYGSMATTCGTTCCALGWAALDPEFQKQGLELAINTPKGRLHPTTLVELNDALERDAGWTEIRCHDQRGEYAATSFFGISYNAMNYLFMPGAYETLDRPTRPEDVIARVDEVIALDGRSPHEDA